MPSSESPAESKLPWYQFSLRSLLILTVFAAVICSIGAHTYWSFAVILAIGGVAGGIASRSWLGLMLGVLVGFIGAVVAVIAAAFLGLLIIDVPMQRANVETVRMFATAIIGAVVGGILGGRVARYRSER